MQHEVHDEISVEIGRRVAARLRQDPGLLRVARDNLDSWLGQNSAAPALVNCYREWQPILEGPLDDICQILEMDDERGRRMRQNSPFAGVLAPREVWAIKADIRRRHAQATA